MSSDEERMLDEISEAYYNEMPALTIELSKRFLNKYPQDHWARFYLGMALRDLRRFDEAKWALEDALLLYPGEHPHLVYRAMGRLYELKGDSLEAEHYYRKAIKADSDDAGNYIYLGAMFAKLGQLDEAEEQHRQAIKCMKGCIDEGYLNLGFILRAQERYVEAYECFQQALEIDPEYDEAKSAFKDLQKVIALLGEA